MLDQSEFDKIQADLRNNYPNLHIFKNQNGLVEIAGVFPLCGEGGQELDRYSVSIILPPSYPEDLPIVYEVGGRIRHIADRHFFKNGSACIFIPDDRWRCFPPSSEFIDYLKGPLHNFFLSQTYYDRTGEWPFGEWSHDSQGILEYYQCLIDTQDMRTVFRFLLVLAEKKLKKEHKCPCGSNRKIKRCCIVKIRDLRKKIKPIVALNALRRLLG